MTRIVVDSDRPLGRVDRNVFGGFVEHLGRCIYGGLYEEGSPLADARGFRGDVLGLLRELRMGVLRWPGGNFVSNYHWTDGIGPKDSRPRRPELAWGGEESNRFGTDEFLAYCAEVGTEPYICLNMGTGTLAEALAWIEYCNGTRDTEWTRRRREGGRAEPYRVRYWGLGNEMYGDWQVGAMSAEEYVREATRWARAIKMLDPQAELVSCGKNGWNDWDRVVIDGMAGLVDYHSLHIYTGSDDYWTNVLQPHQTERAIGITRALLERAAYNKRLASPPRIAYDEWNVWFRTEDGTLEERYAFPDALAVGTYLNIFVRNADWVRMANLAQLVNAIAPIVTAPDAVALQPIYYPVLLHATAALDIAADVHVTGPVVSPPGLADTGRWPHRIADLGPFAVLDAAATVSADRDAVAVTVVNRNPTEPETVDLVLRGAEFHGDARIRCVTAERDPAARVLADVESAHLEEATQAVKGAALSLTLPPQSDPTTSTSGPSATGMSPTSVSPAASSPATKNPASWYTRSVRVRFTARATGSRASAPADAFHAPAVTPALRRAGTTTPVAPNAAADRTTAPRLRGSVTPSRATMRGGVGPVRSEKSSG
jgi:alpha-N-arabinofuranosidase